MGREGKGKRGNCRGTFHAAKEDWRSAYHAIEMYCRGKTVSACHRVLYLVGGGGGGDRVPVDCFWRATVDTKVAPGQT